jgi:hypothetical protein
MRRLPPSLPTLVCGDFNGSPTGNVFKAMLAHGFVSAVDEHHGGYKYARPDRLARVCLSDVGAAAAYDRSADADGGERIEARAVG